MSVVSRIAQNSSLQKQLINWWVQCIRLKAENSAAQKQLINWWTPHSPHPSHTADCYFTDWTPFLWGPWCSGWAGQWRSPHPPSTAVCRPGRRGRSWRWCPLPASRSASRCCTSCPGQATYRHMYRRAHRHQAAAAFRYTTHWLIDAVR